MSMYIRSLEVLVYGGSIYDGERIQDYDRGGEEVHSTSSQKEDCLSFWDIGRYCVHVQTVYFFISQLPAAYA